MSAEIVCVGYTCPICKRRVAVLRSCDPILRCADLIISECKCGYGRPIKLAEVQGLDVWRESATQAVSALQSAA